MRPALLIRALRLPFITASVLPFAFGSAVAEGSFAWAPFLLGLAAVVCAHLGANLANDWADSKSGNDWQDLRAYGFFGGSKLIQEGALGERFYLYLSAAFFAAAAAAVAALSFLLASPLPAYAALFILCAAWSYSAAPLSLSYRYLGEPVIFALFGPAVVMGGHYLQTGIFPDVASFLLSLPFGFLTTAILYANEIPDLPADLAVGKRTWASVLPAERAYLLYIALEAAAFGTLLAAVLLEHLHPAALLSLAALPLVGKAARILKSSHADKDRLVESAKLTIAAQTAVSLIAIGAALL